VENQEADLKRRRFRWCCQLEVRELLLLSSSGFLAVATTS